MNINDTLECICVFIQIVFLLNLRKKNNYVNVHSENSCNFFCQNYNAEGERKPSLRYYQTK